jgi:alpha,alpha-trehalase
MIGPQAMIFDLDGVITFTARVHAAVWKELFDQYLRTRASLLREPFREFTQGDYLTYVDGKPRYEGVNSFLASRGIPLPYGQSSDPVTAITVCGLGNRKDSLFVKKVREVGVDVDHDAVKFVQALRDRGVRVGLASSSRNAALIINEAKIGDLFDSIVDGIVSENFGLRGKPEPDIFLQCLSELTPHPDPWQAGIVEDSISGVEAGRRGGFSLVLGIDRHKSGALACHGANWVIDDFREITADQVVGFFNERARVT